MKNLKNALIVLVLSFFVLSLNAQTEAGKILVGGSSSLSFSAMTEKYKSDDADGTWGKSTSFSLAPDAGYFVIDGLAVGLQLNMGLSSFKQDDSDYKSSSTMIVAAPFVKYYYGTGKVKPFATASIGFGSQVDKDKNGETTTTDKTGIFGFGGGIGAAMFMNDNVALELGIGYTSMSTKAKEDNDNNRKDINAGVQFQVGITVVL
ncbi:MAG TPA: outer membrane beta-barrel protein [Bacteroidales bacterium]|nr:outer membrane beta-barrel protein [Bacteroidales bacterium]